MNLRRSPVPLEGCITPAADDGQWVWGYDVMDRPMDFVLWDAVDASRAPTLLVRGGDSFHTRMTSPSSCDATRRRRWSGCPGVTRYRATARSKSRTIAAVDDSTLRRVPRPAAAGSARCRAAHRDLRLGPHEDFWRSN
jgi:hypothetical protein